MYISMGFFTVISFVFSSNDYFMGSIHIALSFSYIFICIYRIPKMVFVVYRNQYKKLGTYYVGNVFKELVTNNNYVFNFKSIVVSTGFFDYQMALI